jgi:hypothetical protein
MKWVVTKKEFEDVIDWIERLEMATKFWNYDEVKLFKIARFNLKGKVKEWYKHIELALIGLGSSKGYHGTKYGVLDPKEIRINFDAIMQEPRQWVQLYYDRLEKLLYYKGENQRGGIETMVFVCIGAENKLYMLLEIIHMELLLDDALEVEKVLGELGETPYEAFK